MILYIHICNDPNIVNFILYNIVNKKFSISFSNEALQVFFFFFVSKYCSTRYLITIVIFPLVEYVNRDNNLHVRLYNT